MRQLRRVFEPDISNTRYVVVLEGEGEIEANGRTTYEEMNNFASMIALSNPGKRVQVIAQTQFQIPIVEVIHK